LLDGDGAAKMFQHSQEKVCEKIARQIYGVNEPYKPLRTNAVKSYLGSWTH